LDVVVDIAELMLLSQGQFAAVFVVLIFFRLVLAEPQSFSHSRTINLNIREGLLVSIGEVLIEVFIF